MLLDSANCGNFYKLESSEDILEVTGVLMGMLLLLQKIVNEESADDSIAALEQDPGASCWPNGF